MKKRKNNKAQISLEFLMVLTLVLLLFIVMGIVIYQKYSEYSALKLHVTGRTIANTIADSVNQISVVGDGYSQYFTITTRYPGDEFNVSFRKNDPIVFVENEMTWYAPLLTTEIVCCLPNCDTLSDRTVLHLNSTLTTRAINYQGKIYIGDDVCTP